MNTKELCQTVAKKLSCSEQEAKAAVEATFDAIRETLAQASDEGEVSVHGFGKFSVKPTKERVGRNPRTGEDIIIPPGAKVQFTAAKALKDAVSPEK
ncbi:hypothetical protein CSR02_14545 [Acetobacter pomorum]|uniref:HU family DNA-binding protein n=1 Tax=Acetobacter pomorum TaxID=65959 RepID=A0A2G4RAQ8_9PROT|nr:HU family DNA-binding protein [Acetobacter pomorum]PHY92845.1 hypothetical protein CSR02_14545 [Acetobacter pomorum]GBR53119.1 bacterial nucleoid DNA-binding protein [Acetobacter pomorum DSM 11825]